MDPIADMLVRIQNGQRAHKDAASFGYSKIKWDIAKILEKAGFLGEVSRKGKKSRKLIETTLLYEAATNAPKISEIRRVSKLGKRVYQGYREIHSPRSGFGIGVYSTPRGIMLDREARKEKVGGELLCTVW